MSEDLMADTPPIPGVSKIYHYWTDFTPNNTQQYRLHCLSTARPEFWRFRTNIDPEFFQTKLEVKWQRRFLFQMYEHYVLKGMT